MRGSFFRWYQQDEYQIHRCPVDGVIVHRLGQGEAGCVNLLAGDAAVGNGHALAETRAAEAFPVHEFVENLPCRQIVLLGEQIAGVLKQALA